MYGVRTRRVFRGFGLFDVNNPAACGITDLGVTKGICWCSSVGQTVCDAIMGPGSYAAAIAAQSPTTAYPNPPAPVVPSAPQGTAVPSSEVQAATLPGDLIAQAEQQTQQQNLEFFKQVGANLDQLGGTPSNALSTTALIAIGLTAGVGFLLLTAGGRRRR